MEGTGATAGHAAFPSQKPLPGALQSCAMINGRLASDMLEESL